MTGPQGQDSPAAGAAPLVQVNANNFALGEGTMPGPDGPRPGLLVLLSNQLVSTGIMLDAEGVGQLVDAARAWQDKHGATSRGLTVAHGGDLRNLR